MKKGLSIFNGKLRNELLPSPLPGLYSIFAGDSGGYHPRLISGVPPGLDDARQRNSGFTLLELLIASVAACVILIAIYGFFTGAIRMRDNASARDRATVLQARATSVIRNDLENALISGGILASTLQGDSDSSDSNSGSSFPGYLKLTTTGGKDLSGTVSGTTQMYGDVQQVEYYIVADTSAKGPTKSGDLVRVVTRDLLDSTPNVTQQQQIMSGVASFQVSFYDGSQWQTSWQITGSNSANSGTSASSSTASSSSSSSSTSGTASSGTSTTLPEAIRIDIQQVAADGATQAPAPVEVLVPWNTTPFLSGTNFSVGSDTTATQ